MRELGTAYETEQEIVILGTPDEEIDGDEHNCDLMGCGRSHVLYRINKYHPHLFVGIAQKRRPKP